MKKNDFVDGLHHSGKLGEKSGNIVLKKVFSHNGVAVGFLFGITKTTKIPNIPVVPVSEESPLTVNRMTVALSKTSWQWVEGGTNVLLNSGEVALLLTREGYANCCNTIHKDCMFVVETRNIKSDKEIIFKLYYKSENRVDNLESVFYLNEIIYNGKLRDEKLFEYECYTKL